jgi:hypothetical protein
MKTRWREALLALALMTIGAVTISLPPLPQPETYHAFAETRTALGIPQFGDVLSNLAFVLVGLMGLAWLLRNRRQPARFMHPSESWAYLCLFGGITLVGIGSAYYHWEPTHQRLYWDRLPMTVAFMAIFAAIIGERIGRRAGLVALPMLIPLGMAGATHWLLSELQGAGDLRLYLLTQVVPLIGGGLLILLYRSPYTRGGDFIIAAGWYLLSLAAQSLDHEIHALTAGWVSGHTLKHLLAATAIYWILRMLQHRRIR